MISDVVRWLLCVSLLGLGACGSDDRAGSVFESYRESLAATLDLDPEGLAAYRPLAIPYPERQARTVETGELNVGLRTFWAFKHCELRAVIAERNTVLGRAPSAVLVLPYEHALLVELERCAQSVDNSEAPEEFLKTLARVRAQKLADRDAAFWNATFGAREFVALFSPSAPPLALEEADAYVPLEELRYFRRLAEDFGSAGGAFERERVVAAYQGLELSAYGGRLLKSLHEANFYLAEVVSLFDAHVEPRALCPLGASTRRARELEGALKRYHLRTLQPHLATLGRRARPWLEDLTALAEQQRGVMPERFEPFYLEYLSSEATAGLWRQHMALLREHAKRWTGLLEGCGLSLVG